MRCTVPMLPKGRCSTSGPPRVTPPISRARRDRRTAGRPVGGVTQVEADALHGAEAAEGALLDERPAADDLADQQVAEVLADGDHEPEELRVKLPVDDGAGGRVGGAVVERPAVGDHAVAQIVAQGLPLLEQVEPARA